jgi:hypothetical protein
MRKILEGSRIERGRKNRTNIRKNVVKAPATVAHTMRRRILFTGGSELASTTAVAVEGFAGAAAFGGAAAVVPVIGADN